MLNLKPVLKKSEQTCNILQNCNFESGYFKKMFEEFFWPFSILRIWHFLKLLLAKFGLFNFFWTWQPWFVLRFMSRCYQHGMRLTGLLALMLMTESDTQRRQTRNIRKLQHLLKK